jgi:predicted SAM-dependent methyltransferase
MSAFHWGCGPAVAAGWVNSDVDDHGQDHVGDIRDGLPYNDATFGYTVSHHTLQMLPWAALVPALAELRRVTAAGGWLRLSVPDLLKAIRAYDIADVDHFHIADEHETSVEGKFCMYVTQAGSTRSVFTAPWLVELCGRAGWARPRQVGYQATASPWPPIITLDTRPDESAFVEAVAA